ncbi:hypothetical protein SteCoe_32237 [Stentor coeruleus]|uniref:Major facilitator superfamily (MFS) profile domain-containing protein n=1 Tax=Stentor coeruleus TaxID=5963 RepID=A0A1R2AZV7_9CILI|nr:hypothetical protein SteCoe_32237 [Stentor coeruleus]
MQTEEDPLKPENSSNENSLSEYEKFVNSLRFLRHSELSLHLMFLLNFLMSFQYYILVTLIPLYFTEAHDYSDLLSGVVFGCFGCVIGIFSILIPYLFQGSSLKIALSISSFLGISGFVLLCIDNVYISLGAIIGLEALSCSLTWPFIELGIKKYSQKQVRKISSSLFYICNYSAGIFAGIFIDVIWTSLEDSDYLFPVLFISGACSCLLSLIAVIFLRPIYSSEGPHIDNNFYESKSFWRYLGLIVFIVLLRSACFGHLDTTFPKYIIRVTNDDTAHFGVMLAVHSVTIIVGIFTFTILTYYYTSYSLIIIGGLIGTLSTSLLIFWNDYFSFVLMTIGISAGESLWVPRLLDYTYEVAPKNEEPFYLALSNFPFYFGMIITGVTSGLLLEEYCPEDGEQNCEMVWLIILASSLWIPIAIFLLKPILQEPKNHSHSLSLDSNLN